MVLRGPIVRENAKFGNFSTIIGIVSSFGVSKYNMNDINHLYSVEHVFGI